MDELFDSQITFCYTKDLETTADFYENVMGLPLVLDQGQCRIYATGTGAFLGFCRRIDAGPPEGVILTLVTQDVDGWYRRLRNRGVTFQAPPAHNEEYRIYHCFLTDPNGYKIELQRFEDPRWKF